jgi:hypothetical protein
MATVSSSGSPCLSPIRYSLDTSQFNDKSANMDENLISMPTEDIQSNQNSLPIDDSSLKSVCLAQNYSSGRILTDITTNTSVRSSFLKSPIHPNVSGPVLGTPDYLSNYFSIEVI